MTTLQSKINEQNQIARQIVSLNSDIDKMYNKLRNLPSGGFITDKETYLRQDIEEAESEVRRLENERDRLSDEVANPTPQEMLEDLCAGESFNNFTTSDKLQLVKVMKAELDEISMRECLHIMKTLPKSLFFYIFGIPVEGMWEEMRLAKTYYARDIVIKVHMSQQECKRILTGIEALYLLKTEKLTWSDYLVAFELQKRREVYLHKVYLKSL